MTIHVTQQDIEKGVRGSCFSCPIALAVKRETKSRFVSVAGFIMWDNSGSRRAVTTPNAANDFMEKYDVRRPVQPFSFELPVEVTP